MCVYVTLVSVIKAERVEEAGSLVEPQRGNEKNKQPLPVPLWPETLYTLIPPTITTSVRKDEQYPPSSPRSGPENAEQESIHFYCPSSNQNKTQRGMHANLKQAPDSLVSHVNDR